VAASRQIKYPALQLGLALAVSGTVGAFALEAGTDAMTTVFWRCAFGATFLAVWCLVTGKFRTVTFARRNLLLSALAGAFLALCWACLFSAFAMTSIATATIVFQSYPFLLVLAGVLVLGEKLKRDQLLWMIVAFIGVPLASGVSGFSAPGGNSWGLGVLLTFAAALAYVVTTMSVRAIKSQPPEVTMMLQAMVGALVLSLAANFHQPISLPSWGWLVGMGIIHSGLVMVAMYSTYPLLSTPVIAIMNFIYPAVAILLDWIVYGHPLTLLQGFGLLLIVVATLGVNLRWRFSQAAAAKS
jgi:drug/metabolite transporter (DMT)-like permease